MLRQKELRSNKQSFDLQFSIYKNVKFFISVILELFI